MQLSDLERHLESYYSTLTIAADTRVQDRVLHRIDTAVRLRTTQRRAERLFYAIFSKPMGYLALTIAAILLVYPLLTPRPVTVGTATGRDVIVLRDGQSLAERRYSGTVQSGDSLSVTAEGYSEIVTPAATYTISQQGELLMVSQTQVRLRSGSLGVVVRAPIVIETERGTVSASKAQLRMNEGETGDIITRVLEGSAVVRDTAGQEVPLEAGMYLTLREDTSFAEIPQREQMTGEITPEIQQQVMQLLTITRSKSLALLSQLSVLSPVERATLIESARASFATIASILQGRSVVQYDTALLNDEALRDLVLSFIPAENEGLTQSVHATSTLLSTLQSLRRLPAAYQETGVRPYDAYVVLGQLQQVVSLSQWPDIQYLQQQYLQQAVGQILTSPLQLEQIRAMSDLLRALPTSEESLQFLLQLQEMLPPNLQPLLAESIDRDYNGKNLQIQYRAN
ncbi:hypothetical protein H6771_01785 [Candidatus Peribacteria bacterium]|nr:hypothetical protein [Candidatus Peribacteria bacterium]